MTTEMVETTMINGDHREQQVLDLHRVTEAVRTIQQVHLLLHPQVAAVVDENGQCAICTLLGLTHTDVRAPQESVTSLSVTVPQPRPVMRSATTAASEAPIARPTKLSVNDMVYEVMRTQAETHPVWRVGEIIDAIYARHPDVAQHYGLQRRVLDGNIRQVLVRGCKENKVQKVDTGQYRLANEPAA